MFKVITAPNHNILFTNKINHHHRGQQEARPSFNIVFPACKKVSGELPIDQAGIFVVLRNVRGTIAQDAIPSWLECEFKVVGQKL
ncbi:hypothetical protein AG1IA_07148 [Rhizoctonia solani AG-1 IA]|uniref:Uncharacterized protein n=1 Tax=Thanatephorus cucumeris (strain AG1-IA) TaxID=983506 RepID=L8WPZ0_THACA|nr:hypothetical protein AG1IA_07148 [Rhizoctonia solani AG-1 IA]